MDFFAWRTLLFLTFVAVGLSQSLPPELRRGLQNENHFSTEDIRKIEAGQAVARMVSTGHPDDVRMLGIVLIKVTTDAYIKGVPGY